MKRFGGLIAFMMLCGAFSLTLWAESYRKTTEDMFRESYTAAMSRQTPSSPAEIRAEMHGRMYEVCNEHHNCRQVTGIQQEEEKGRRAVREKEKPFVPFYQVPSWW